MKLSSRPSLRAFAALALTVGLAACATPPITTTTQPVDTGAAPTTGVQEPAPTVQQPTTGVQEPTTGVQEPTSGGGGGTIATPEPTATPGPEPTATPEPEPSGLPTPRPTPTPEPTPDLVDEEDEPNDVPDDASTLVEGRTGVGEIDDDGADLWAFEADGHDLFVTLEGAVDAPFAGDLIVVDETGFELYRETIGPGEADTALEIESLTTVPGETYYIGFERATREGERDYTIQVRTED